MNKYPLWKYLLIFFVVAIGCIYSAPNLYSPDPAIQITGEDSSIAIDNALLERTATALQDAGITLRGKELVDGKACLLRLENHEAQLAAQGLLQRTLGDSYVIALNLAPTTPRWLAMLGAKPMKLGLDLSGGVHFLLEVDTPGAVAKRVDIYSTAIKRILREAKIRGSVGAQGGTTIVGRFADESLADNAAAAVYKEFPELQKSSEAGDSGVKVSWSLTPDKIREMEDYAVSQNLTTLRNRVNELGVAEPLIQRQGRNRIVVELPGVQDAAAAKRVLGKTANLEFRLEAKPGDELSREKFEFRDSSRGRGGQSYAWLQRDIVITGERVTNAKSGFDPQTSRPEVNITLDSEGGTMMNRVTRENVGQRLGVLFIERKSRTSYRKDADGVEQVVREPYYENRIISLATIQSPLGVQFRITGLDSPVEAAELALLLRAGALAAPMDFIEERTVGPSLGADNISRGFHSTLWGFVAIAAFMIAYYMLFGLISVTALATNLVLLLSLLSILQATLTLPGIAAIALALGMAIDANVLINERIREELRNGLPPQSAIAAGYERALATIVDSNVTTFIVGIMLLAFGSGPVRGFAVVHCLGILTSIFSAVMVSRAIVNLLYGSRPRLASVAIGQIWRPDAATAAPSKR
jgi:preprotein translocase subunit SecD